MLKLAVLRSLLLSLLRSLLRLDALWLIVASLIARTVLPPISHKHFLSILSSFHDKSLPWNESADFSFWTQTRSNECRLVRCLVGFKSKPVANEREAQLKPNFKCQINKHNKLIKIKEKGEAQRVSAFFKLLNCFQQKPG